MWFSSKPIRTALGLAGLFALLSAAGCMSDTPNEHDMPWNAPAAWEGSNLPAGFFNQHE